MYLYLICTLDMDICSWIYYSTYVCMYAFYSTMYVHFMYACKLVCNQTSLCSMYACIFMIFDHVCMRFRAWNPLRASKNLRRSSGHRRIVEAGPNATGTGPNATGGVAFDPQRYSKTGVLDQRHSPTGVGSKRLSRDSGSFFAIFHSVLTSFRTRTSPDFINYK